MPASLNGKSVGRSVVIHQRTGPAIGFIPLLTRILSARVPAARGYSLAVRGDLASDLPRRMPLGVHIHVGIAGHEQAQEVLEAP